MQAQQTACIKVAGEIIDVLVGLLARPEAAKVAILHSRMERFMLRGQLILRRVWANQKVSCCTKKQLGRNSYRQFQEALMEVMAAPDPNRPESGAYHIIDLLQASVSFLPYALFGIDTRQEVGEMNVFSDMTVDRPSPVQ